MKSNFYFWLCFYYLNLTIAFNTINYHESNNEPVGIERLNPKSNLEEACSHYLDCHNCTVARCYWWDNSCQYPSGY